MQMFRNVWRRILIINHEEYSSTRVSDSWEIQDRKASDLVDFIPDQHPTICELTRVA